MITAADFEHMMKMRKAQELRRQGHPPELALILAGVEPGPELGEAAIASRARKPT